MKELFPLEFAMNSTTMTLRSPQKRAQSKQNQNTNAVKTKRNTQSTNATTAQSILSKISQIQQIRIDSEQRSRHQEIRETPTTTTAGAVFTPVATTNLEKKNIQQPNVATEYENDPPLRKVSSNSTTLRSVFNLAGNVKKIASSVLAAEQSRMQIENSVQKAHLERLQKQSNLPQRTPSFFAEDLPQDQEEMLRRYVAITKAQQSVSEKDINVKPNDSQSIALLSSVHASQERHMRDQNEKKNILSRLMQSQNQTQRDMQTKIDNANIDAESLARAIKDSDAAHLMTDFTEHTRGVQPQQQVAQTINDVAADHQDRVQTIVGDALSSRVFTAVPPDQQQTKDAQNQLQQLKKEIAEIEGEKKIIEQQNREITQKNEEYANRLKERLALNADAESAMTENEKLKKYVEDRKVEFLAMEMETGRLNDQIRILQEQNQRLQKTEQEIANRDKAMSETIEAANASLRKEYENSLSVMAKDLKNVVSDADQIRVENARLTAQLNHKDRLLVDSERVQDQMRTDIQEREVQLQKTKQEGLQLEAVHGSDLENARKQLEQQNVSLMKEKNTVKGLIDQLNVKDAEVQNLQKNTSSSVDDLNKLRDDNISLQSSLQRSETEQKRLQDVNRQLTGDYTQATSLLSDQEARLNGLQKKMEETEGTNATLIEEVNKCRESLRSKGSWFRRS